MRLIKQLGWGKGVFLLLIVVLAGGGVVWLVRPSDSQPPAVATAHRWAEAVASGDLATARQMLNTADPLAVPAFDSRWPNTLRVFKIEPDYVLSQLEDQGQSTYVTVHFRTDDAPFCLFLLIDAEQRVTILNQQDQCAWPTPSERVP
jgi:hypothetical protein